MRKLPILSPILLLAVGWTAGCLKTAQKTQSGPPAESGGFFSQLWPGRNKLNGPARDGPDAHGAGAVIHGGVVPHNTAVPAPVPPPTQIQQVAALTPTTGPLVGQLAPEIAGADIDGVPFRLSDYRGKVVVLDFWGHW
jgi:hypothetical protein